MPSAAAVDGNILPPTTRSPGQDGGPKSPLPVPLSITPAQTFAPPEQESILAFQTAPRPLLSTATADLRLFATETAIPQTWEPGTGAPAPSTSTARPALPPQVALQIAEAVRHLPNRPVEIALSPEELGRVRLSVATGEGGIIVNVLAERPETLDLLRRHIDTLGQEFHDLGFDDVAFSFAGGEGAAADPEGNKKAEDHGSALATEPVAEPQPPIATAGPTALPLSGLDLRL